MEYAYSDIIQVKDDLIVGKIYAGVTWLEPMQQIISGKQFEIVHVVQYRHNNKVHLAYGIAPCSDKIPLCYINNNMIKERIAVNDTSKQKPVNN